MRIAYVTDQRLPRDATDTLQIVSMITAFAGVGVDVCLVVPKVIGRAAPTPELVASFYGVKPSFEVHAVQSLYPGIRGIEKLAHGVAAALDREVSHRDVLYTRNLPVLAAALAMSRVPVVYETYRPWPSQRPWTARFFRRWGNHPQFLGAVLHSRLSRDSYLHAGIPEDRLLVAHNGFDPGTFAPAASAGPHAGPRAVPRPVVGYTGHISVSKGLMSVLDMAQARPQVSFVLVGSNGTGPVERRASALPNVTIVPWVSTRELGAYLASADVLLIPPTAGPLVEVGNTVLPIKTFQYMAAARAILAPSTPDLLEILEDGRNARLVEPDRPEAALAALDELTGDPALRQRLGDAARESVAGWTWESRALAIRGFIDERLGANRARERA